MSINKIIGDNIKKYRQIKNLTLEHLGEMVGLTKKTIQRYETGEIRATYERLSELADALGAVEKYVKEEDKMKIYQECTITPHHGGFCMWEAGEYNGDEWHDLTDLLGEIGNNVDEYWVLGEDELPEGVEDIRGKIYNEPDIVIAVKDKWGNISYSGVGIFEK